MEKILKAYADIGEVLPRLDRIKSTFGSTSDLDKLLALIYADIMEFHQRAYKMFRRRVWHFWFACDWGLFESRFKSIISRLASHCELLDKEAASMHFLEMKAMRDRHLLEDAAAERYRRDQMAQDVFTWLSAAEDAQEEYLHHLSDQRVLGTCDFILEESQISSWVDDESGPEIIWITAKPGGGKSFLCSLIIEHLPTRHDLVSLYYFCGRKSSDSDSCALILRTLTNQLLRQDRDLAPLIHQNYLTKGSSKSRPAMKKILKEILPSINSTSTRIILDGVDECGAIQRDILADLIDLQRHVKHRCKILVASRDEPSIRKSMLHSIHIPIESKTEAGLKLYIQGKVSKLRAHFPNIRRSLWTNVEEMLQRKANGMFLWVRLVTVMLEQQMSEAELEEAVDKLPDGLDEAYGRILSRIGCLNSREKDRALRILFWVCTAYRSVTIHEVADGITLKPGQTGLTRKTRPQNVDRNILDICAPFLERSNRGILDMVHFSAKEYLLDPQSGPLVDAAQAHFNTAFSCIVNLTSTIDIIPRYNGGKLESHFETMLVQGAFGLQQYAHQYWAEHAMAYFQIVRQLDNQGLELLSAFELFLKVFKHSDPNHAKQQPGKLGKDLNRLSTSLHKLNAFPQVQRLIMTWMQFKSRLQIEASSFDRLQALEDWKLAEDDTFLSLIDSRLCHLRDGLLRMQVSNLPPHIDQAEYRDFLARFGFTCRFFECSHSFDNENDRDQHEASHVILFPCPQCDFSGRGFKTRKQLKQHTRTYHMAPEDFDEIPSTLEAAGNNEPRSFACNNQSYRRHGSWNDEGRSAVQRTFRKILFRVVTEMTLDSNVSMQDADTNPAQTSNMPNINPTVNCLDDVRVKVDTHQYESLAEFKNSICHALRHPATFTLSESFEEVDALCDQELKNIVSKCPDFASLDNKISIDVFSRNIGGCTTATTCSDDHSPTTNEVTRAPYWSKAEESEFPRLIQRYGRDSNKIAMALMTKLPEDVDEHFAELVNSGREDLVQLADATDIEGNLAHTPMNVATSEKSPTRADTLSTQPENPLVPSVVLPDDLINYKPQNSLAKVAAPVSQSHDAPAGTIPSPQKRKRRSRRKALCNYCQLEFSDEHAVFKHVGRAHVTYRKLWICEDVSPDGKFLDNCRPCSKRKKYATKSNSLKHLRVAHFKESPPSEVLTGWLKEIEGPNPFSDDKHSKYLAEKDRERPGEDSKRQKTSTESGSLQFRPSESRTGQIVLPSIIESVAEGFLPPLFDHPDLDDRQSPDSSSTSTIREIAPDTTIDGWPMTDTARRLQHESPGLPLIYDGDYWQRSGSNFA